jgi:hypothetical protein
VDHVAVPGATAENVSLGACPANVQCVESQEWTYGIDNTGTRFNDVATYCLELSDGSTLEWSQDGSSTSWTPQLQEWSANIQAAADNAGIKWFVEPRFVDNPNPTNIDGTINGPGGTPSGLPGAPSVPIAVALIEGGMAWRYVNFQICPGQPVPVRAYRKTSQLYGDGIYDLTTAGAVLGPLQKFWLCAECGEAPIWYLEDGVTFAEEGQIPNCWEPCGTLALTESPPDRECDFFFADGCDNQNDTDPLSFIQGISRRTTVCSGEITDVSYLKADVADPTVLEPHELVGQFVDCASGVPIAADQPDCQDFSITKMWSISNVTPGLRNREWHDTAPTAPLTAGTAEGRAFRDAHDFALPTTTDNLSNNLQLNDTDNTAGELDVQVKDGYVIATKPIPVAYSGASEGYWAVELGYCCGELQDVAENGGFFAGRRMDFTIPEGIHRIRIWNIDSGGSNSSANLYLQDATGELGPLDNLPEGLTLSLTKPEQTCYAVKVCKPSGVAFDLVTGDLLDLESLYPCEISCVPPASNGGSSSTGGTSSGPTAQEIAEAMVTEERARVSGRMENWQNEGGTVSLDVPPGTMGCIKTITDYGAGAVYWTLDGSTPSAANGSTMSVQYGNVVDICGVDLSLVRLDGSSGGSDFSVTYEVWS